MFRITLENLRFYSRIGVVEQERQVGNDFRVDCAMDIPSSEFRREDISGTVSYADIYEIIKETMAREWQLLESVALEIADRCRSRWPSILSGSVKITKLTPPIPGIQGCCGVEYRF